ncbi:MAG TPA: hypothetical protein VGQ52_06950 [Gemmatimonadaceae bacterium]|jgi:hypothetical protein|nr:hypothetical protein [Gemmatimonadaceae bacterium]
MTVLRRVAAVLTLALSLESTLLGSAVACAMPGGGDAATMAGMHMAGMDMTGLDMMPAQPQPGENPSRFDSEPGCSFPWSPPRDCHDMEACAPVAIAVPAVTMTLATAVVGAVVPRALAGPRSVPHTPDPPPPRA